MSPIASWSPWLSPESPRARLTATPTAGASGPRTGAKTALVIPMTVPLMTAFLTKVPFEAWPCGLFVLAQEAPPLMSVGPRVGLVSQPPGGRYLPGPFCGSRAVALGG